MRSEVGDLWPLFLDAAKDFLDLDGMTPPHWVTDTDRGHLDPRRIPECMLFFEKLHHRLDGKITQEIGAKAGICANTRLGRALLCGLGDDFRPYGHLLHLRAVGIAPREHIAHMHP